MIARGKDYEGLLFWIRFAHVVAAFLPSFLIAFVFAFQTRNNYPSRLISIVFLGSVVLAGISFTPLVVKDLALALEEKNIIHGSLFPLYAIFFAGIIIYALYRLARQLRLERGIARYQIRYFLGGIFLAFVLGSLSNLFLPLFEITTAEIRNLGPLSSLVAVTFISYALVKSRLINVHMVLKEIIAYSASILLLASIYVLPLFFLPKHFLIPFEAWSPIYLVAYITVGAILFQPLKEKIYFLVNRYLYSSIYDYFTTLFEGINAMVTILHRDELIKFIVNRVVHTVKIQEAAFYLNKTGEGLVPVLEKRLQSSPVEDKEEAVLSPGNPLLEYLKKQGEILLVSDLRDLLGNEKKELIEKEMDKRRAEVAVPLFLEGELEGVLFLGPKLSGEPYTGEDENLFKTLVSQLTVAFKNARLYQEVLEIKQYLENILENMGNGLIAVNDRGIITTFNNAAARLTGIPAGEAVGRKVAEVLPPGLQELLWQTLHNGKGRSEIELEIVTGNSSRYLSCSTVQVVFPEAEEKVAILVLSDVTRIKELEKEKNQAQRLASLGEMAAGMAHEIKNPLVSIKTFAELLPEKYDDPEFRYSFSRIVSGEIERINKLLQDLFTFSREVQLYYSEVNLEDLLEEVLLLLSPQINSQGIDVFKEYSGEIYMVKADKDQLRQALFNICLNSVQAMPCGGILKIKIIPPAESFEKGIQDFLPNHKIKIVIQDTGEGIPLEQQDKVFDPFFTTKAEGMGIGLSISHKIITAHGGSLQFTSDSRGTTFEIFLPSS